MGRISDFYFRHGMCLLHFVFCREYFFHLFDGIRTVIKGNAVAEPARFTACAESEAMYVSIFSAKSFLRDCLHEESEECDAQKKDRDARHSSQLLTFSCGVRRNRVNRRMIQTATNARKPARIYHIREISGRFCGSKLDLMA